MERTRVVAIGFEREGDLASSLKGILERAQVCSFHVREARLAEPRFDMLPPLLADEAPHLVAICPPANTWVPAKALLEATLQAWPGVPILMVGAASEPKAICEFLRLGASDFIIPPLRPEEILPRIWKLITDRNETLPLSHCVKEKLGLKDFIGESRALLAALAKIPAVAQCDASVLITGETGTGKELCARAIHYLSTRADKAFMPVNCGAIPLELVENQLFGHETGAFTGASSAAVGLLRACDGGTLLLDEIDALPLAAQVKLLRVLQERQFQPLGSTRTLSVNLRIVAACNTDLEAAVRAGRFRQDLYYRLNVVPIHLPPLRQRREDIPLLARHFLRRFAENFRKPAREFGPRALQKLVAYDWPGNVRELENVVERAVVLSDRATLTGEDLLLSAMKSSAAEPKSFKSLKAKAVEDFERTYLQEMLCAHHGNITQASRAARKDRRAFWQLLRKHCLVLPPAAPRA